MKALGQTGIIALVFVLSMIALLEIKGETMSGKRLHCMVFLETNADWKRCQLTNCRILEKESSVGFVSLAGPAQLLTSDIYAGFPFKQLILSWNAVRPDTSPAVEFIVEVSPDSQIWHRFDYQTWGPGAQAEGGSVSTRKIDGIGWIDVDYLVLEQPMKFARVIVRTPGGGGGGEIILRRMSLAFSTDEASWDEYHRHHGLVRIPDYSKIKLSVPYHSQLNLPEDLSGNCCSPTSVCMVLNYHNIDIIPEEMARLVYDSRGGIYGNWPHNVAAAYEEALGKTWVEVHCGFDEIYSEIAAGRPVVISIAFDPGELPFSPIRNGTEGHLIAVVGFDGPNTVICNDPAGRNAEDGIIDYPRKELEDVWLRHGGIAYHLWPAQ